MATGCRIDTHPLTLSNPRHLEILEADAQRCKADSIIVDTLTAAFEIENENDNAEGSRIMKKLTGLAQRLNCVVVFLHYRGEDFENFREDAKETGDSLSFGDDRDLEDENFVDSVTAAIDR